MVYTFTPDLVTGNTMIDSQHKELIKAINDLLDACNAGKGREALDSTLKFLNDYTAKHFSDEEVLQQKYKYPDFKNHHNLHEGFKQVVSTLSQMLQEQGPNVSLVGRVNSNIAMWLLNHIKKEDKKLAAFIKEKS